jgi:hypothetical protein
MTIISDAEYESVTWPPDSIEILEAPGVSGASETISLENRDHKQLQWCPDERRDPYSHRTLKPGETVEIPTDEWRRLWGSPGSANLVELLLRVDSLRVFEPKRVAEPNPQRDELARRLAADVFSALRPGRGTEAAITHKPTASETEPAAGEPAARRRPHGPRAPERKSLLEDFRKREQERVKRHRISNERIIEEIPIEHTTFYAWLNDWDDPKKNISGVDTKIRLFLKTGSIP